MNEFQEERDAMVRDQLERQGIRDRRVLEAMRRVPRHRFVPDHQRADAYADRALPIDAKQTISQPLMVAIMTELLALSGGERVLEIGAGSGYQAAILAELGADVVTIERVPALADSARTLLSSLGYNVEVVLGDGTLGYPPRAPYDRILVTAGAPHIPEALIEQLAAPGRLVIPVGSQRDQMLMLVEKDPAGNRFERLHGSCVFVPLFGEQGWHEESS